MGGLRLRIGRGVLLGVGFVVALHAEVQTLTCKGRTVKVEAVAGTPFGVGFIRIEAAKAESAPKAARNHSHGFKLADFEVLQTSRVSEAGGRLLYPVRFDRRGPDMESAAFEAGIFFLFKGLAPLSLSFASLGEAQLSGEVKITPAEDPKRLGDLSQGWWDVRRVSGSQGALCLPANQYLDAMLARRLGLNPPPEIHPERRKDDVLGLLLGLESVRLAMQKEAFQGARGKGEVANLPLPEAVAPPEQPVPAFDEAKVQVEPMTLRVPASCFYLRTASFDAFVQLMDLVDARSTEVRTLLSNQAVDQSMKVRLERQLVLHAGALSRMFGGHAVKEMAVIGRDTFFNEGSAVGILMEAKQAALLRGHLEGLRKEALAKDSSVRETRVTVAGREVSLLESPGNAVRSFYVQDGDYHLVTNSRWIVEAFLKTQAQPESSLGRVKAFRYARAQVSPASEGAFFYLSDAFFRDLVGPAYRVEMSRRALVDAELTVVAMARAAAQAEGMPSETLAELVAGGFLPEGVGAHVDGSTLSLAKGLAVDSLRGARGSLLPVPDVAVTQVSASELDAYEHFSSAYKRLWQNMDPVYGTLQWQQAAKRETVTLELHISPYVKSRYGMLLGFLGKATKDRISPVAGDLLALELHPQLKGMDMENEDDEDGAPKAKVRVPVAPTFFGGLRDIALPWRIERGEVIRERSFLDPLKDQLRGYLGQTPAEDKTARHLLGLAERGKPDAEGFISMDDPLRGGRRLPAEAQTWGRRLGDFFLVGTGKELVGAVSRKVKRQVDTFPAQVRLRVGDLHGTQMASRIRAELYARDRRASVMGALGLQALEEQFHAPDPKALSRSLFGAEPCCALGGTYRREVTGQWRSDAWKEARLDDVHGVPEAYQSPLQRWVRGLSLDLAIDEATLSTRFRIEGAR